VECLTRDAAASTAFYEDLFGWKSESGTGGYVVFASDGERVAGLMAMPEAVPSEAPSYWLVYFSTDDVERCCERALAAGGVVLEPTHEIDEGRFAVVADPCGAVFAVFEQATA
jgi:predicted enzyme related to lactoylglutathione lyase